ncbi:hypothetical protein A3A46_04655 [Candidatus Roizmanbacteria bacterium RIFCSPLOWO2_01_FULL_37_13]|uniref:Uncharacterized protein n=1 Tax=Candidatus Roizmanbacteria bacterium RIFCSPHIGHO2_02_FULL_38_11 TaxID=1802039 RepID=A0A1F7GYJ5_9BACT|nr:MAG: hypothetical protein A3C25_04805 [Candidatus Roizmanbacteria bacterium RIFCSPHIGHO2_02_FULL_38_11]OGK41194.1 MAG: hypothetical protein A3A46_04655 [Candidatus Roizmanbacteria bacterium RIFCSPLOWO2_01_FULL_37_13]
MKKGINLLKKQKRYISLDQIFKGLKVVVIIEILLFLAVYPIFYFLLSRQKKNIDLLSSQKKNLLEFFIENKITDAKFIYFRSKQKQLSSIVKQDANFFPYYNLLKESFKTVGVEAGLESFLIDETKAVSFRVGFENYSILVDFLRFAESEDFLKHFSQLVLINFSNVDATEKAYKLSFSGTFVNIND